MRVQLGKRFLREVFEWDTSDQDRIGLRRTGVLGVNEVELANGEEVAHFTSNVPIDPN